MELMQLRYYVAVVQEGSINRGARRLGMTQPPVSAQIRLLEQELGCQLFERGSRSIRLTEEGKLLYDHAVRILNMAESAANAVMDCHSAETGTLRIGVVSSLADVAAERWFRGFAARHPLVNFELSEGSTYELLDRLRSRMLDAALVRTPFSARGLECVSLPPEDMLLIGGGAFLGGLPREVAIRDAAALPLIVYRRWSAVLDQAFAAQGCRPRIICTADDARTCLAWAGAGLGVAVTPMDALASPLAAHLESRAIRGLSPAAATTLAVNEGGCDTEIGRRFASFFRSGARE